MVQTRHAQNATCRGPSGLRFSTAARDRAPCGLIDERCSGVSALCRPTRGFAEWCGQERSERSDCCRGCSTVSANDADSPVTVEGVAEGIRRASECRMIWGSQINSPLVGLVSGSGVLLHSRPALLTARSDGCPRSTDSDDADNGLTVAKPFTVVCRRAKELG
jgi:hypothetical protein